MPDAAIQQSAYTNKKEIQSGAVAQSYIRKGIQIYEEMRKYFPIYDFATAPLWISLYCIWGNFDFLFYQCSTVKKVSDFLVPSREVTNQTLPVQEKFNYSRPESLVSYIRLVTGKLLNISSGMSCTDPVIWYFSFVKGCCLVGVVYIIVPMGHSVHPPEEHSGQFAYTDVAVECTLLGPLQTRTPVNHVKVFYSQ